MTNWIPIALGLATAFLATDCVKTLAQSDAPRATPPGTADSAPPTTAPVAATANATTAPAVADANDDPPPKPAVTPPRAQRGPDAMPANLRASMNQMLDILFDLKNEAPYPDEMTTTITDIARFERDVAYCKLHPPSLARFDEDKRADEAISYQATMSDLMGTLVTLEDAVRAHKYSRIKATLAKIDSIEEQGHEEFVNP
jgi:hypothetical protein